MKKELFCAIKIIKRDNHGMSGATETKPSLKIEIESIIAMRRHQALRLRWKTD